MAGAAGAAGAAGSAGGGASDPSLVDQAQYATEDEQGAPQQDPLDLPPTQRALLPEETAWIKDTNRIRKARGLPLKTAADIPAQITQRAVARAKSLRR